jgi:protein PhnA
MVAGTLESGSAQNDLRVALDCNGAPLNEDDSVTVIKDLKVKGGSSDLKRGTLIRKIRLTPDPKLIECRVDGSVLVLKTEFLKKA